MNPINLILLTKEGCSHCEEAKKILKKISPDFPGLKVQEIDILTPKGQGLVGKYTIMATPGIIINGQLFSMGGTTEEELKNKLKEY